MIKRCLPITYPVLAVVSNCYPRPMGRLLMYYSPVRHSRLKTSPQASVRLACIRHAASVHPEPGSNSPFVRVCQLFVLSSLFLRIAALWIDVVFVLFFLFSFQRSTPSREVLINITKSPLFCQHLFLFFLYFLPSLCFPLILKPFCLFVHFSIEG